MYKQVDFRFENLEQESKECLHYYVDALVAYYDAFDLEDQYHLLNGRKETPVVKINNGLDDELFAEIWVLHNNRFRQCHIQGLSKIGGTIIFPFEDRSDAFSIGRPFTLLVEIGKDEETGKFFRSFTCKSMVRNNKQLNLPQDIKDVLSKLNSQIHIDDKEFFPNYNDQIFTIDYALINKVSAERPEEEEEEVSLEEEELKEEPFGESVLEALGRELTEEEKTG